MTESVVEPIYAKDGMKDEPLSTAPVSVVFESGMRGIVKRQWLSKASHKNDKHTQTQQ